MQVAIIKPHMKKEFWIIFSVAVAVILALTAVFIYLVPYVSTPEHIRRPALEHLHFRTQIVVDGQAVDFSHDRFQQPETGSCSEAVSKTPIDFHDNLDQMTHIHWKSMTGGELLKYYGWNEVGGQSESLGYRFDQGAMPVSVPIHGKVLPEVPITDAFYVYIGNENSYQRKDWNDFLHQDFEAFFGKKSNLNITASLNWLDGLLFKRAAAHGGINDGHEGDEPTAEELQQINNLIGNVVIFVQPDEPSSLEVKDRFKNLVPLQNSTCGG